MKPETILKATDISKRYLIGERSRGYNTFREALIDVVKSPFNMARLLLKSPRELFKTPEDTIWALRDVSFEVKQGEVVGIIGRNGAGKSTLLKVLSKITEPTKGHIELRGRVGSLLEVGTGFHPELTGHENIYLYGAILGMDRWEVTRKFNDIVAFAENERFIETPVKRYSSGMYMRLAFAVAAYLETEILLVDEVLAVGDAAFQKKCLSKIGDVATQGRTVLFVSHNMGAIQALCSKAMLIESGRLAAQGEVKDIVKIYLTESKDSLKTYWSANEQKTVFKNEILTPIRLSLLDKTRNKIQSIVPRDTEVYLELEFDLHRLDNALTIGFSLFNQEGFHVFRSLHTDTAEDTHPVLSIGRNTISTRLPTEVLNEGDYWIVLDGGLHNIRWLFNPMKSDIGLRFSLSGGLSQSPFWINARQGVIAPILSWTKVEDIPNR